MLNKDISVEVLVCFMFPLQFQIAFLRLSVKQSMSPPRPTYHSFSHQSSFPTCRSGCSHSSLTGVNCIQITVRSLWWHLRPSMSDPKFFSSPIATIHYVLARGQTSWCCWDMPCILIPLCVCFHCPWKTFLPVPSPAKPCRLEHFPSLDTWNYFFSCLDFYNFLTNRLEGVSGKMMVIRKPAGQITRVLLLGLALSVRHIITQGEEEGQNKDYRRAFGKMVKTLPLRSWEQKNSHVFVDVLLFLAVFPFSWSNKESTLIM